MGANACLEAVGSALIQKVNDGMTPLGHFSSHIMNTTEQNHTSFERKPLFVVFALNMFTLTRCLKYHFS